MQEISLMSVSVPFSSLVSMFYPDSYKTVRIILVSLVITVDSIGCKLMQEKYLF